MVKQLNFVFKNVSIRYFKNKEEIKKQISYFQLSHQTVAKRVESMSRKILEQLLTDLKNASGFVWHWMNHVILLTQSNL